MTTATKTSSSAARRIYVACLAAYNNGILHGAWVDCDDTCEEELQQAVADMLARSPITGAEEFAIHDTEGFYDLVSESTSLADVAQQSELLSAHGDAWAAYAGHVGAHYATAEQFQDAYAGTFDNVEAYAQEYVDSTGMLDGVLELVARYFDMEAFARDLVMGGDIAAVDVADGVAIFHNC